MAGVSSLVRRRRIAHVDPVALGATVVVVLAALVVGHGRDALLTALAAAVSVWVFLAVVAFLDRSDPGGQEPARPDVLLQIPRQASPRGGP